MNPDLTDYENCIPNEDSLYFYVFHSQVTYKNSEGNAALRENAIFKVPEQSCDWSRMTNPMHCRELLAKQFKHGTGEFKNPNWYFISSLDVNTVRTIHEQVSECPMQKVVYNPIENDPEKEGFPNNPAHSLVLGAKNEKLRAAFSRRVRWAIAPPANKADMEAYKALHAIDDN